ncbi:PEP-CTERM sorting domain-containing protein [Tautonia plasticadhaerens]|uniref:PEP-CTERM protein-sorting domain-containing protein n=1 Tax=Tautonia plasticadhaerens TaxID=2527974 RepID=A0A518H2H9_9BACT|nr:PEP-CTERM sorting domain-containing protein [Tautonia plasticadhaerens]QDV35056.1 hypothetical protein ElP_29580 [Tautonia plasticadhaerens]
MKMSAAHPSILALALGLSLAGLATPAAAETVIDFDDVDIPGDTELTTFSPYQEDGYTLTATNPPTGFSSGLVFYGENSIFYAGSQAASTFAPDNAPFNILELTNDAGTPFALESIDLARNFAFDPAPTVTFTGVKVGGAEVMQSFTVTTPVGVAEFQTFAFSSDFSDLVALRWGQPILSQGLHQFDNIRIQAIPEPGTAGLLAVGALAIGAARLVRRRPGLPA